jgi:hypothetical protein
MRICLRSFFAICLTLFIVRAGQTQDLEPRRWTPVPLDLQVVGLGYGYTSADILFDPVLLVEDTKMKMHFAAASYVTSFRIADKLARFDVTLPWASAEWEGLLNSEPTSVRRVGILDPRFRVSINLSGTPAVNAKEMRTYLANKESNTVVGAALSLTVPLGEYSSDKLINFGENRYTIRPQIGVVHTVGSWSYELTGSIFFYTNNNDFFGNTTRRQKPLYTLQTHIIYEFNAGKWLSVSAGYGVGGQSSVDRQEKDDKHHTLLSSLSFGMPLSRTQAIKVVYLYGQTNVNTGANYNSLLFAFSHVF